MQAVLVVYVDLLPGYRTGQRRQPLLVTETVISLSLAYLIAKHEGGDFILRIEDTDQERYVEGAVSFPATVQVSVASLSLSQKQ